MSTGALVFMLASWSFVVGLTVWSFGKILQVQKRKPVDPDKEVHPTA